MASFNSWRLKESFRASTSESKVTNGGGSGVEFRLQSNTQPYATLSSTYLLKSSLKVSVLLVLAYVSARRVALSMFELASLPSDVKVGMLRWDGAPFILRAIPHTGPSLDWLSNVEQKSSHLRDNFPR